MLNKNEEAKLIHQSTQQHTTNEMEAKLYMKLVSVFVLWEQLIFRLMHGHIIILIRVNKQTKILATCPSYKMVIKKEQTSML
jgi:hypothetical protein